jgi:copper chaperone
MSRFIVEDMTCDGCVRAITGAVRSADPGAELHIDLATHLVDVAASLPDQAVQDAIADAGFSVRPA